MSLVAQRGALNAVGFGRTLEPPQLPQFISMLFKNPSTDTYGFVHGCSLQDTDGSIYVGGMNRTNSGSYIAIWKFSSTGTLVWSRRYTSVIQEQYEGIAVDSTYVYVCRSNSNNIERYYKSNGSPNGSWGITGINYRFLVTLSDGVYFYSGNFLQKIPDTMTGTSTRYGWNQYAIYFSFGQDGNIYNSTSGGYAPYYSIVYKVNPSTKQLTGNLLTFGSSYYGAGEGYQYCRCTADASGNIYAMTKLNIDASSVMVLAKINAAGTSYLWKKKYTINGYGVQFYQSGKNTDIIIDSIGRLFIASAMEYGNDYHFLQINPNDGTIIWNRTVNFSGGAGVLSKMRLAVSGQTLNATFGEFYGAMMTNIRLRIGATTPATYVLNGTSVVISAPTVTVSNDSDLNYLSLNAFYTNSTSDSGASATDPSTTNNSQYLGPYTATLT